MGLNFCSTTQQKQSELLSEVKMWNCQFRNHFAPKQEPSCNLPIWGSLTSTSQFWVGLSEIDILRPNVTWRRWKVEAADVKRLIVTQHLFCKWRQSLVPVLTTFSFKLAHHWLSLQEKMAKWLFVLIRRRGWWSDISVLAIPSVDKKLVIERQRDIIFGSSVSSVEAEERGPSEASFVWPGGGCPPFPSSGYTDAWTTQPMAGILFLMPLNFYQYLANIGDIDWYSQYFGRCYFKENVSPIWGYWAIWTIHMTILDAKYNVKMIKGKNRWIKIQGYQSSICIHNTDGTQDTTCANLTASSWICVSISKNTTRGTLTSSIGWCSPVGVPWAC